MSNHTMRTNMIKQQLRTGEVLNETILALYEEIPRDAFVPGAMRAFAYSDMQIPLAHHQRMLTPLEEGKILQALQLSGSETVLEVGTGSGYFTALLSRLCKKVISIEYFQDLSEEAALKLQQHDCTNIELIVGDASKGWLDKAPYDVLIFTGALETLTKTQLLQVSAQGKLIAITGKPPVMHGIMLNFDDNENYQQTILFETNIPLLIDELKPKEFVF